MDFTIAFIKFFIIGVYFAMPLLLFLFFQVLILGQVVGRIEGWTKFDAFYWSFITALTVGYGDIRPLRKISKVVSIAIAFIGIMFTGIIVAITVSTATKAFEKYVDMSSILEPKEQQRRNL
ncbi:potassium channel family protein [Motiliproteus sp. MSK22-1]|uniref:potassium channel family protein n=1 Tax=Motiliproteus sp. MSK22-1 TaxID=1897630 RepID=UPI000975B2F8|nr:potassium channel family protein [Motiliproteus sp. MSK22-1]OMH39150.1 Ion channel protein [Motiliproteus sp. MSK22-1]